MDCTHDYYVYIVHIFQILLQVSKLCPGEYPTAADILITNVTDDTAIPDIISLEGSQYNILTTVDTITLQPDMIYIIQVSFSNLVGEFNITSSTNFSKWIISCDLSYYLINKPLHE